jgi:Fur family ferric uptake transcriptional regulator
MGATDTVWTTHAVEALRAAGHRSGGARSGVIELLARQDCCVTAQEIFDGLRQEGRRAGIASVYRTLELLRELRLVQRLDVGDGTARYEPAHPGGDHHHHLVCDRCGKVEAFEDHTLEEALDRLADRLPHRVAAHDVVLRGDCGTCAGAA